jgi:hypothetical protein
MCRVLLSSSFSKTLLQEAVQEALIAASRKGYLDTVKVLIEGGAKADAQQSSALASAMAADASDVVQLLLQVGIVSAVL